LVYKEASWAERRYVYPIKGCPSWLYI
jgi:hypothetical protein